LVEPIIANRAIIITDDREQLADTLLQSSGEALSALLGFGVYLAGVSRVPALAAALIGLAEIPLAPIWALLLFDETVNMLVLMGGVIILTAAIIYLLNSNMEDD